MIKRKITFIQTLLIALMAALCLFALLGFGRWQAPEADVLAAESEADELSLSLKTDARQRIQAGQETDIDYLVEGALEKYDVTYQVKGSTRVETSKGSGYSVRVKALDVDYFTVTVIYTHKTNKSVQHKLDIDVYSVDSLTYSPVWSADPFDGMPSETLTNTGHLLYFDATSGGGLPRNLTMRDVSYSVIEKNITASSGGTGVEINYVGGNEDYPYLFVNNLDDGVATGNFTLKMILTDPYTGYSAAATKKFTVTATKNSDDSATLIQNYVKKYPDFYEKKDLNLSYLKHDVRLNMVLTKTGIIVHRTNGEWSMNNGNEIGIVEYNTAAKNCRLEFEFDLLAANASGGAHLGIGLRTVREEGWVGYFNLQVNGGLVTFTGPGGAKSEIRSSTELAAAVGTTLYVRIDRFVVNGNAEYTVYAKTDKNAPFEQYYRCMYAVSSNQGNAGAPVKQYQFDHRGSGGCYAVEGVTITDFGA